MDTSSGYGIRIISVYGTHWRHSGASSERADFDFDFGERSAWLAQFVEGQLPQQLANEKPVAGGLMFSGTAEPACRSIQVLLFALPFPADQVVAALILDIDSPDLNRDSDLTRKILRSCADAEVQICGTDLAAYIDGLATRADAKRAVGPWSLTGLPLERHHLLLIRDLNGAAPPEDGVVKQILYGIEPPYRPEFTELLRPPGLNLEQDAYGAISSAVSFLYGHPVEVQSSVFLTTLQAVGTASRFQQIWQEAYHQVQQFQTGKQAEQTGVQLRGDLETLADHMGNLELDLAFSVETAADLGLRIPSLSIDSFHNDLYTVMQIRTRAATVGQMFVRLGGSIRSELTAIESRERRQEEGRRLLGGLALGILTFLAAPLAFIIGFFGMNSSQVPVGASMWDWHLYHWTYLTALLLLLVPVGIFFLLLHGQALRRRRNSHQAAPRPSDPSVAAIRE